MNVEHIAYSHFLNESSLLSQRQTEKRDGREATKGYAANILIRSIWR
jgi:hypothetical protein